MINYIYKTTNLINGRYYVGVHRTDNIRDCYYGSGKLLRQAIRKYGKKNFKREILMIFDSYEKALHYERLIVNEDFCKEETTYNLREGGSGSYGVSGKDNPFYGETHSKETRELLSNMAKQRTGELNPFYGRTHTEETVDKIKKANTGKPNDRARKGWWITPYGKFRTYKEAAENSFCSTTTIKRRCKTDCDKIVGFSHSLKIEFKGNHTWRELGWYFLGFEED